MSQYCQIFQEVKIFPNFSENYRIVVIRSSYEAERYSSRIVQKSGDFSYQNCVYKKKDIPGVN